jgi:hypothetical protein
MGGGRAASALRIKINKLDKTSAHEAHGRVARPKPANISYTVFCSVNRSY